MYMWLRMLLAGGESNLLNSAGGLVMSEMCGLSI
jgi:hypothetical protein